MSSSTRLPVKALHFNRAQNPFALHFFPNPRFGQLLRGPEADHHWLVLENHFIHATLSLLKVLRRRSWRIQIDRRNLPTQMERNRLKSKQLDERGRKQMLPGVLLHVVDAARPVDHP